jgi:hypothetical protein
LSLVDFRKPFADLGVEVHAQRPKAVVVVVGLVEFLVPQLENASFFCVKSHVLGKITRT